MFCALGVGSQHQMLYRPKCFPAVLSSSIPPDYVAISDLDSSARSAAAAAAAMMNAAAAGDPNSAPPSGGGGGGMNLPSLRIEGCTPPSESSLEGEEQLYKCEWDPAFSTRVMV